MEEDVALISGGIGSPLIPLFGVTGGAVRFGVLGLFLGATLFGVGSD